MNTLMPRRLFFKSINQTHNLLDPKRIVRSFSKVGRGQARQLSYTNLVSQLVYRERDYAYIVDQFAADSSIKRYDGYDGKVA